MSNVKDVKPDATGVFLGGKNRTLSFDLNSYAELEKIYGSVQASMDALQSGSIIAIRNMLWAGLIHDEAVIDEITGEPIRYNISPYMVGKWVSPNTMGVLTEKVNEAMTAGMSEPDERTVDQILGKVEDVARIAANGGIIATIVPTEEEKAKN